MAAIFDIARFCVHDGPGIRTTVFFKGCPLACWWCHNPEGQRFQPDLLYFEERCRHCGDCAAVCPRDGDEPCRRCGRCAEACVADARRIAGRRVTLGEVLAEIEKDVIFFEESGGGVTLSGGEPVSQPHFAAALLAACRDRGIHTALETCGFGDARTFLQVAGIADLVLFDLKLLDPEKHRAHTGVSNRSILANLDALAGLGRPFVVRIPVTPGVNDNEEDMRQFAEHLSRIRPQRVDLLPYHRAGSEKYKRLGMADRSGDVMPPSAEKMVRLAAILKSAGLTVEIGGEA